MGLITDMMARVAQMERETMRLLEVKRTVRQVIRESGADTDGNGMISKKDLQTILEHPMAVRALEDVEVDVEALVDFADLIFQSDGMGGQEFDKELTFEEFMHMILHLRGNSSATVQDIVDLKQFVFEQSSGIYGRLAMLESHIQEAKNDLRDAREERESLKSTIMDVHNKVPSTPEGCSEMIHEMMVPSTPSNFRYAQYLKHHKDQKGHRVFH